MDYKDPGEYIPIKFLVHSWGSLLGVPSKIPLMEGVGVPGYSICIHRLSQVPTKGT